MAEVNRFIKDGKVAVATPRCFPGYGAGWASWAKQDVMETFVVPSRYHSDDFGW